MPEALVGKAISLYETARNIWPNPEIARTMAMISMAETEEAETLQDALGIQSPTNDDGTFDIGAFQVNSSYFDTENSMYIKTRDPNSNEMAEEWRDTEFLTSIVGNAMVADFVGRHLDYPNEAAHLSEGDIDFTRWTTYKTGKYLEFGDVVDQAIAALEEIDVTSRSGIQPSQWASRPQMPGTNGRPGDVKATFDQVSFDDRVRHAMMDKNTPKVMPLQTRMSAQEFSALQRGTQDPGVKAALSKHAENFRTGNAGFLGYETDEAASTAAKWLRVHGIGVDPQFPFIAYSLGKQAIDKTGDIASQLWDKAIGSLWGGSDGIDRSAYLDSGSDEISDDLNPERR